MSRSFSAKLIERDHATVTAAIYRYTDIALRRGEGVYLYDFEGRKYLDFVAGIATMNVGHCHPAVVEAICDQARRWRSWCLESPRMRRKSSLSVCQGYRVESGRGFMTGEAHARRAAHVI